ncbi:MAG TPA: hypothetical protein VFW53_03635 [Gallionella sp.]|nr:hypothetical protein [Gallionella sp.]
MTENTTANTRKNISHSVYEPGFAPVIPLVPTDISSIRCAHCVGAAGAGDGQALMRLIEQGDFDAKQKLVTRNLCQVLNSYRGYANNGLRITELLKAGHYGLVYALASFEQSGAADFSSYAGRCIREHIGRVLLEQSGTRPALPKKSGHARHRRVASCAIPFQPRFA